MTTPTGSTSPTSIDPAIGGDEVVGIVGSPSKTAEITMDVVDGAAGRSLLGDLVYTCHPLDNGRHLLALGTVGEIETRNRWHEDPNMRGVLRMHGRLPHLSADGDVRTATLRVQAVYETSDARPPFRVTPRESGGSMTMSPTTGEEVCRVDEQLVQGLVAHRGDDIAYLGRVYRSSVRLPMFVRDFNGRATDGAFHTGVFGRSGSGKTAFVTYLLALQMRHRDLSVFVFDPQGQFTRDQDLVLPLQRYARAYGRDVVIANIAEDLQLPGDAGLAIELLGDTPFYRALTIGGQNKDAAHYELEQKLRTIEDWATNPTEAVLRTLLTDLAGDDAALTRIFRGPATRDRLTATLQRILSDAAEFETLLDAFAPIHSLFANVRADGSPRYNLRHLLYRVTDTSLTTKPYVVINLSNTSGTPWLDSTETKARLMRKIASELRQIAERQWRDQNELINCSVIFDEAHRFAAPSPEGEQTSRLSTRLADYVRETRKTGLGWTFITQEATSINPAILNQLTIKAYGYGLTAGSDRNRLRDEIGAGAALDLYASFPDPKSLTDRVYPFMLTGPISPLTFTAAPVFMEVFTSEEEFREANEHHLG